MWIALRELEARLASDPDLRTSFLQDPGELLRAGGVPVDDAAAADLRRLAAEATTPYEAPLGSCVRTEDASVFSCRPGPRAPRARETAGGMVPATSDASARVLLVVPPFAAVDRPSIAAHLLQACAAQRGHHVDVLYANVLLARILGEELYNRIAYAPSGLLLGERMFAAAAYATEPLGRHFGDVEMQVLGYDPAVLRDAERRCFAWAGSAARRIADLGYPVIGFSSTFEQTAASLSLLRRIKALTPRTLTLLGGANCEGPMGPAVRSLAPDVVDYVFSGECEQAFPDFLDRMKRRDLPAERIIQGAICRDLDALPSPVFDEYYDQLERAIQDNDGAIRHENTWLPYESSRGCWWGAKHHCTFCGLNADGMQFRASSPERVLHDLDRLSRRYPTRNVSMVDNIMPHGFHRTLIPALARQRHGLRIFYEQKANMSLSQVAALRDAGVHMIQPGIEALSTPLLRLMDKGVTASQNIHLLRCTRAVDMSVNWNLLWGFPGDRIDSYTSTLGLIDKIVHLHPPTGLSRLSIERFSPYFERPAAYGVENIRPRASYRHILPPDADCSGIAYHFEADYTSESRGNPEVIEALRQKVAAWQERWMDLLRPPPVLSVARIDAERYVLVDTRDLAGSRPIQFLSERQARVALGGAEDARQEDVDWAAGRGLLVDLDGDWCPLAVAAPALLGEMSARPHSTRAGAHRRLPLAP
ncbi:RiPP maturation radical SAM C-methyltransferase [Sorangium sp. So ce119]|uniref:RiPP maturation radical SAM C-methyltransferase n=1 Tax=Sorangium sp. So ce119 TaxID=3133279 RepID=UPI003F610EED